MRDRAMLRLDGTAYRGTALGPPAVRHGAGELRITAVDLYSTGLHVHILYWLPATVPYTSDDRLAARATARNEWPDVPDDQLDDHAEIEWLRAQLPTGDVIDRVGTEYLIWESAGDLPDRRSLQTGRVIYPFPPAGEAVLRFGATALVLPTAESASAEFG